MALRADLAEELLAINRLESQTFDLVDDDVREELRRLADEKKAHALVLLGLLQRLDPKFGGSRGLGDGVTRPVALWYHRATTRM